MKLTPKLVRRSIGIVIAIGAGWYFLSPLVMNRQVNESLPTAGAVIAQEPAAMKTAVADSTAHVMDEPMPLAIGAAQPGSRPPESPAPSSVQSAVSGPILKAQGQFANVVHEGRGKAEIFQLPDGGRILRLEDFQVLNGPDLHVYLTTQEKVGPAIGVELQDYVDLGKLKGNQGAQNYPLPATVDLGKVRSAVIWCQPFRVPFIAASLAAAP